MLRQCVTCGRESDNKKEYFELSAKVGPRYKGKAAVSTTGEGNVSIELNGESTLRSD